VSLQWIFLSRVRRGPSTIDEDLFHFDFFRLLVWEGIRKKLNSLLLSRFFDFLVDWSAILADDYPIFTEEILEKYWV
jgi:hypothetical protein